MVYEADGVIRTIREGTKHTKTVVRPSRHSITPLRTCTPLEPERQVPPHTMPNCRAGELIHALSSPRFTSPCSLG